LEQGSSPARNNIGWLYQNGFGVKQDYAETVKWYRKAASQSNTDAQNNIG
jgi:TPR repeat protein